MMKLFYVIRKACLQEDEGHSHLVSHALSSFEEAKAERDKLVGNDPNPYFRKGNFVIVQSTDPIDHPRAASEGAEK